MKEQRCLYCERPLALLSRLTGDGEFCSKEHRRIYQKEHSQLALARLLQAQPAAAPAPAIRRSAASTGPPSRWNEAAAAELVETAASVIVERLEQKPRNKDPEAVGFRSLRKVDALAAFPAARIPDALWSDLPSIFAAGRQSLPRFASFVAPGSFLRRQPQATAPSAYPGGLKRGGVPQAAFSTSPAQMRFLEERLQRTERIGFCPP